MDQRKELETKRCELQEVRRQHIMNVQTSVFPIQVQALSMNDAGDEGESLTPLALRPVSS